jgi:prepilin-type N-terminal cleavage/methylation domain-containing protein
MLQTAVAVYKKKKTTLIARVFRRRCDVRAVLPSPLSLRSPRTLLVRKGFNAIELAITLTIAGIIAVVVLPHSAAFIDSIEVRGAVTEIEAMFSTARHAAIARAAQASLEIDPALGVMSVRVGDDAIRTREIGVAHGVTLATNRATITYSPTGIGYGAANMTMIVSRNRSADTIYVSRLGRVRH